MIHASFCSAVEATLNITLSKGLCDSVLLLTDLTFDSCLCRVADCVSTHNWGTNNQQGLILSCTHVSHISTEGRQGSTKYSATTQLSVLSFTQLPPTTAQQLGYAKVSTGATAAESIKAATMAGAGAPSASGREFAAAKSLQNIVGTFPPRAAASATLHRLVGVPGLQEGEP